MTAEELHEYLRSPHKLNKETLSDLQQLVAAYPYAHTFVFLYLYNLALLKDLRYFSELKYWAVSLPSRSRLYALVEKQYISQTTQKEISSGDFSSIDRFLEELGTITSENGIPLGDDVVHGDYFGALEQGVIAPEPIPLHEKASPEVREPHKAPLTLENTHEEETPKGPLFTETLAKIYIRQQRYDRALNILQTIMSKNPEKNAYFADQIRFLERLQEISNRE